MRNTAFLFLAMQTVTSSTNYAINQIKTAESPELPTGYFASRQSQKRLCQKCTSAAAACVPPVMTRWMAIRAPVALGRHGWARCVDTSVVTAFPTPANDRSPAMQPRVPGARLSTRDAFSLRGFTRAFEPYPHRTCPSPLSAHPKAPIPIRRRDDTPDGKSGSREPKSPRVGARGGAPKGPRKNRRVGSENQFAATIGRLGRRRQAPPSVSKTPVVTNNVDEPVDDAKRALVGALAAVALAAAPVADAMTDGMIGNVDVAQLFELAGFGAPTGALDSPPLPEQQLKQILDLDERAALRKASLIRTGNYDVLLQVGLILLNIRLVFVRTGNRTDDVVFCSTLVTGAQRVDAVGRKGAGSRRRRGCARRRRPPNLQHPRRGGLIRC